MAKGFFPSVTEAFFGAQPIPIAVRAKVNSSPGLAKVVRADAELFGDNWGEAREKLFDEYLALYQKDPRVKRAVDEITNQVVCDGFQFESNNRNAKKLVEESFNNVKFRQQLPNIVKQALIFGDTYNELVWDGSELVNFKTLNSRYIRTVRDDYGRILYHVQRLFDKGIERVPLKLYSWDASDVSGADSTIAHFCYNRIADSAYGTSIIQGVSRHLQYQMSIEKMSDMILKRYYAPFVHVRIGSDQFPAKASTITAFASDLEKLEPDTEWVTPHTVEIKPMGFEGKLLDIGPYFAHFEQEILTGLGLPMFEMGRPEGTNRAQAETAMGVMDRSIRAMRMMLEDVIENDMIMPLLARNGMKSVQVNVVFGATDSYSESVPDLVSLMSAPLTDDTKLGVENKIRSTLGIEGDITLEMLEAEREKKQDEQLATMDAQAKIASANAPEAGKPGVKPSGPGAKPVGKLVAKGDGK